MKIRKPRQFDLFNIWVDDEKPGRIFLKYNYFSLKDMKRLHEWLGRAISYLESKETL